MTPTSTPPVEHAGSEVLASTPPQAWAALRSPRVLLHRAGPLLSVIVPTYNERDNVEPLVQELAAALDGLRWEVIFVDDDSPDGTAEAVRRLAGERSTVRCIQRIGRRGLASACIEGMLGSSAPYVAVMDGDRQHDPTILPQMLSILQTHQAELVVGSRYATGGSVAGWARHRQVASRIATRLGRALVPATLTDPLSGFFVLRRELLEEVVRKLSGLGFKILLDIVATLRRPMVIAEVPFSFRTRTSGTSKLDGLVAWEYAMLLADKHIGHLVPVRFLAFASIGALGVGVHLGILSLAYAVAQLGFVASQALAVTSSMVFNYAVNNELTYRDRRRRGAAWLSGLASFMAACGIGAIANVGMAAWLYERRAEWMLAAVAGVLVGAVWNYAVTSTYTWGRRTG